MVFQIKGSCYAKTMPVHQVAHTARAILRVGLALNKRFLHGLRRWFGRTWEYLLLALVALTLVLFLLGNNLLGFDKQVATLLALAGTLVTTVVAFVAAALVLPLVALLGSVAAALMGAVTVLIGMLVTPLIALATGLFSSAVAWFATTWLGTLLSPVYYLLAPLVLKIGPWLSATTYGRLAFKHLGKHLPALRPQKRPARRKRKT
jgi:hypothetical protein